MTRSSSGEQVRLSPGNWIAIICFLIAQFAGFLVYMTDFATKLEKRLTTVEVKIEAIERRP